MDATMRRLEDANACWLALREHLEREQEALGEELVKLALPFAWRERFAKNPIDAESHAEDLRRVAMLAERFLGKGEGQRLIARVTGQIEDAEHLGERGPEAAAGGGR